MSNVKYFIANGSASIYNPNNNSWTSVGSDHKYYNEIINAIVKDDVEIDEIIAIINKVDKHVNFEPEEYSKGALRKEHGISRDADTRKPKSWDYMYGKLSIPEGILAKIQHMQSRGYTWEQCEAFFKRCAENPHPDSVYDLFRFIERYNLTILKNGHFIAYKGLASDYYDKHSHTFCNAPGSIIEMPRSEVTYDPNQSCSCGLHVANLAYASDWGDIVVQVEVDPADVVSVPFDSDCQKIRCCRYLVKDLYSSNKEFDEGIITDKGNKVKPKDFVPSVKRGEWTDSEDALLADMCNQQTKRNWKPIAEILGRSAESCRKRWQRIGQ